MINFFLLIIRSTIDDLLNWKSFWRQLSLWQKIWPGFYAFCFLLSHFFLGEISTGHIITTAVFVIPAYFGKNFRIFSFFFFPFILTLQIYDSMQYYYESLHGAVHVDDIYLLEKRLFGIRIDEVVITLNEYWQKNTHWILDFITGVAYLIYAFSYIAQTLYYRFSITVSKKIINHQLDSKQMAWGFFWINVLGYSTYFWFATAPPWYVAEHGLGPANLDTLPSIAGSIRFDQLVGKSIFADMYSKALIVFGAMPSLHVACPALAALFSIKFKSLRIYSISFYLIIVFSSIYLNHHYVIDGLWGSAYALIIFLLVTQCNKRRV